MVGRPGIDMFIITTNWYAAPAMIGTSSPLDGALGWCGWLHHHRRIVRRPGGERRIIIARWYAAPAVVRYRHCRMVRRTNGGKIAPPSARNRRS